MAPKFACQLATAVTDFHPWIGSAAVCCTNPTDQQPACAACPALVAGAWKEQPSRFVNVVGSMVALLADQGPNFQVHISGFSVF